MRILCVCTMSMSAVDAEPLPVATFMWRCFCLALAFRENNDWSLMWVSTIGIYLHGAHVQKLAWILRR